MKISIKKGILIFLAILMVGVGTFFVIIPKLSDSNKISDQNIPPDFIQIKRDIQKGIFYELNNLSKDYYLRPDFYPSYKNNSINHDYSRWGVQGYGAYPGEISYNINNFKKDQFINVYTFVKAGENIETFQGLKFDIDSDKSDQLFDTNITPNTVMFTPTFPVRTEYIVDSRVYDWVYKMNITIIAKKDIPSGIYKFRLMASPPDENSQKLYYEDVRKINQTWYECPKNDVNCNSDIVDLRKKIYVNGGQFQADKFFDITINVGS